MEWLCTDLSDTSIVQVDGSYVLRTPTHSHADCLYFPEPGDYEVVLFVDGNVVAAGEATVDGEISDTYEWSRYANGRTVSYEVTFTYSFEEYQRYVGVEPVRHSYRGLSDSRFVVVDDAITRLSNALAEEYASVHGEDAPRNGQDYADYLLSFVQCAIRYPVELIYEDGRFVEIRDGNGDLYLYGTEEYWAFPMETMYHRMGDCEDTSILLAALYSASGYTSSLLRFPGHMVVGLALDQFRTDDIYEGITQPFEVTLEDIRFWISETAYDHYFPMGYASPSVVLDIQSIRGYTIIPPHSGA